MRPYRTIGVAARVLIMVIVSEQACAYSCENDSIESVSDTGSILLMVSGEVYEVGAGDTAYTQFWLTDDDVLVCDDSEIINNDDNGEKTAVKRLE